MRAIGIALAFVIAAQGQDPYKVLPKNYRLELDNAYVAISRVTLAPREKLAVHSHPSRPTVYVYLTECGVTRFTHKAPKFTIARSPVQPGWVRFDRNAPIETHLVEYMGEVPCEYLRVELKTEPAPQHRDARLHDDKDFPWEDAQIRINRVNGVTAELRGPSVIVDLEHRALRWIAPGEAAGPGIAGAAIVMELKTSPIASGRR